MDVRNSDLNGGVGFLAKPSRNGTPRHSADLGSANRCPSMPLVRVSLECPMTRTLDDTVLSSSAAFQHTLGNRLWSRHVLYGTVEVIHSLTSYKPGGSCQMNGNNSLMCSTISSSGTLSVAPHRRSTLQMSGTSRLNPIKKTGLSVSFM